MGDDAIRALARNIGLVPEVSGHANVQDAIAAGGTAAGLYVGGDTNAGAGADSPTAVPFDGASHVFGCVIAAPPAWMDNASNIIAAGLYLFVLDCTPVSSPTTPGQFFTVRFNGLSGITVVSVDGNLSALPAQPSVVAALGAADLPFAIAPRVVTPTDVTASLSCTASVVQLASVTT